MWLELECDVPQIQFFIAWSAVCTTVHYQCHQNENAKNELVYVSSVYMLNFIFFRSLSFISESQVDELAMELLLLLVILPAVQDQNHTREWLKAIIKAW